MGLADQGLVAIRTCGEPPAGWDELLGADPGADFFHSPAWSAAACANYPDLEPIWLVAESGGRMVGGLPAVRRTRRSVLPLSVDHLESSLEGTSGGPVVRDDLPLEIQESVFQGLVQNFLDLRKGPLASCSISLNTSHEKRFGHLLPAATGWKRRDVPGAVIDLAGGLEKVEMTRLNGNKRNERNRGLRRGAEVFTTSESKWIDGYYPMYESASRIWGIAPVPRKFLLDLLEVGPDRVFFVCVKLEDKVIGGHLCLVSGDRILAWNGVSDPAHARTHFPGTLCFWGDIVEACARGARWLDLGASGGVNSLSGFKKYFGAELEDRGFYVLETAGLKLLQQTRAGLGRAGSLLGRRSGSERWHDRPDESGQADRS